MRCRLSSSREPLSMVEIANDTSIASATSLPDMGEQTVEEVPRCGRTKRSMTLAVPDYPEIKRFKALRAARMRGRDGPMCRKTSLDIPSLNGYVKHEESPPEPEKKSTCRRLSLADAISDSFRTLAMTARRNSSPLSRRLTRKMKRSRMVLKNGMCNVNNTNVPKKDRQYLRDFFTTMIDVKWRWLFMTFTLVFLASWSTFAIVYFLLSYMHGDMDLASNNSSNASAVWEPCVAEVTSLYSAFLYSVETQHTIGYGTRHITTACPAAGMTLCLQCICGLLIQSFMVGLVFAKMARPKKRAETLIFSRHAVVALRDGQLCLLFRVGDMRNTHLVEAHVRLQLITDRETEEGEIEPLHQFEMKVGSSRSDDDRIFLVWPITLCHVIDAESPLYEYASKELPSAQFEIIVLLEGIVESTGMTAQARTSYLPSEIVWGHRFKKLVTYQRNNGSYQIDYNLFHCTYPVTTPQCSAKEFYKMKRAGLKCGQSDHYFCKSESEQKLEDGGRSLDCSPSATPSPLPSSPPSPSPMMITNKCSFNSLGSQDSNHRRDSRTYPSSGQDTLSPSIPPIIVVQSPSSSNSPINTLDDAYSPLLPLVLNTDCHSYDLSTRPSTALSDLEEESSDLGSPH